MAAIDTHKESGMTKLLPKMAATMWSAMLPALLLTLAPPSAHADNPFELVDSQPVSELWLNPGFYSYHYQRDKGLNDSNPGFGAEYRYSTVWSATAGRFYNSDREYSNYLGVYYQPVTLGPPRLCAPVPASPAGNTRPDNWNTRGRCCKSARPSPTTPSSSDIPRRSRGCCRSDPCRDDNGRNKSRG